MKKPFLSGVRLSLVAVLFCSFSSFIPTTDAQNQIPTVTWGPAFSHEEGKLFFIQGGQTATEAVLSQTFAIDLSTAWDTSSVKYKFLPDGPKDQLHASVFLKDRQTWVLTSNKTVYEYNVNLNSWSQSASNNLGKYFRLPAAVDPATNYIYYPNAYVNNSVIQMLEYDIGARTVTFLDVPPSFRDVFSYAATWSDHAKKMVVFGGAIQGNIVNNNLYTFDRDSKWATITAKGSVPSPRRSACMAPAYGGSKIVVFGGMTQLANSVLSDIHILDIDTMTWTKGVDAGTASARTEMSCAVTNDLFIVWGGAGVSTTIASNITIIYNLKRDRWQSSYSPIPEPDDPTPLPSTGDGKGDTKSSNLGPIIGGVVGGLAVIALIIGGLLWRRKKSKYEKAPVAETTSAGAAPMAGAGAAYAPSDVNKPQAQDPWQQQPPSQPLVYSQAQPYAPVQQQQVYTPYQPPIVHDYQQPQNQGQPIIFQPQSPPIVHQQHQQQSYPSPDTTQYHSSLPMSQPGTTSSVYNPAIDYQYALQGSQFQAQQYQSPTVYQPSPDPSTATAVSQSPEQVKMAATPPTSLTPRPPQNPQGIPVPDSYVDDSSLRRGPQAA
ncbi:hypothetical protein BGZ51_007576 [Haplosporangium sp. Z 767]|nr:hypothetical protein BGZ51_007576 [Haplosporangium sp. Z 767]KAF9191708.1 hypothetical protein BGZ50_009181 [Haplosporangium sp. Z 11]